VVRWASERAIIGIAEGASRKKRGKAREAARQRRHAGAGEMESVVL